jgi:hypothetical protein
MTYDIFENNEMTRRFIESSRRQETAIRLKISGAMAKTIKQVAFDTPDELSLI